MNKKLPPTRADERPHFLSLGPFGMMLRLSDTGLTVAPKEHDLSLEWSISSPTSSPFYPRYLGILNPYYVIIKLIDAFLLTQIYKTPFIIVVSMKWGKRN
jgi:hypothetical protein